MRLQAGLAALDTCSLIFAVVLVGSVWLKSSIDQHDGAVTAALIFLYFFIATNAGAFASDILGKRRKSIYLSTRSVVYAAAGVVISAFFFKADARISRVELTLGGIVGAAIVGAMRYGYHFVLMRYYRGDLHSEILIVDDLPVQPIPGCHLIYADKAGLRCDLSDPVMLDRLGRLLAPADRVVVACSVARRRGWSMMLKCANIQGEIAYPQS